MASYPYPFDDYPSNLWGRGGMTCYVPNNIASGGGGAVAWQEEGDELHGEEVLGSSIGVGSR